MTHDEAVEVFAAHSRLLSESWDMSPEGRAYRIKFADAVDSLRQRGEAAILAAAITRIAELQIWHDDVMSQRVSQMFPDFPELIIRPKPLKELK